MRVLVSEIHSSLMFWSPSHIDDLHNLRSQEAYAYDEP